MAVLLACAITAIVSAGAAFEKDIVTIGWLDLDSELTLPSFFSGGLLFLAGSLALFAGQYGVNFRPYALFGGFVIFMGTDEICEIHERLEAAANVDWQILYAPVILLGGSAWALLVRTLDKRQIPFWLMVGGAIAWIVAQVLENVQWSGGAGPPVADYTRLMLTEEMLEMIGSACFVVVMYAILYRSRYPTSAPSTLWPGHKLTGSD